MDRSASEALGFIKPELPTLVPESPTGEGWIHEIKHDGYRTLIIIDKGDVRAFSRHGGDWTGPYRRVVGACTRLSCRAALIDCNSCFVIVIAGMERPLRKVGFLSRP